jgi:hypothetical protein
MPPTYNLHRVAAEQTANCVTQLAGGAHPFNFLDFVE